MLDDVKEFYDPHPGIAGAMIAMPSEVKRVADALSGKKMTVAKAIKSIQKVTDGIVEDEIDYGFISLEIKDSPFVHFFRVIRYRDVKKKTRRKKTKPT